MTAASPQPTEAAQPVAVGTRVATRRSLSPLQQQIWASGRLAPTAPLSNMATASRLSGIIDPDRLITAFDNVVRRSDALRTVVDDRFDGAPQARVLRRPPQSTNVIDLDAANVDDWCAARIAQPIDLASSAYDSVLIRHSADDWTWWLDLHHIVTDAWSSMLVFDLVADAYSRLEAPPREAAPDDDLESFYDHVATRPALIAPDPSGAQSTRAVTPYGPPGITTTA